MYIGTCPRCNKFARVGVIPFEPKNGLMIYTEIDVKCPCGQLFKVVYDGGDDNAKK